MRRRGNLLVFRRWISAGQTLGAAQRQPLTVSASRRYLAVYGRR
jgi:hypothetical protein